MGEKLIPPGNASRFCGLHWLQEIRFGSADMPQCVALQWNPGSQTWTHSNQHDTHNGERFEILTSKYRYVKAIPLPEIGE